MTIYILGTPQETAQALDDKSLDRMIKDIAQVVCNVHHLFEIDKLGTEKICEPYPKIPLSITNKLKLWDGWARACKANYLYLVTLGKVCITEIELHRRLKNYAKEFNILGWARDTVPDLRTVGKYGQGNNTTYLLCGQTTPFLLVMPKKCIKYEFDDKYYPMEEWTCIQSYRNYYQAKLKQHFKRYHCTGLEMTWAWTKRKKPEWVNL